MVLIRLVGMMLILFGVIALVSAASGSRAAGQGGLLARVSSPTSTLWESLAPASYATSRKAVIAKVGLTLADRVVLAPLRLPLWSLLSGLGLAFVYLGRRRRRIKIYTN